MGPKRKPLFLWQCCQCGQAKLPIRFDGCRSCGNPRCAYCPVSGTSTKSAITPNIPPITDLRIGDSVGFEGGDTFAALGPMLECSGKRYFLVPANLFHGARMGERKPYGVKLVHPAEVHCPHGVRPRVIGVFKYWSGPINSTYRKSHWTGDNVVTNWALCKVVGNGFVMKNRLHCGPGKSVHGKDSGIPGIFKEQISATSVLIGGSLGETTRATICEAPVNIPDKTGNIKSLPATKEWYIKDFEDVLCADNQSLKINGATIVDGSSQRLIGTISGQYETKQDTEIQRFTLFTSILDIMDDIREKYPEIGWPFLADQTDPRTFGPRPHVTLPIIRDNGAAQDSEKSAASQSQESITQGESRELQPENIEDDSDSDVRSSVSSMFSEPETTTSKSSVQQFEVQALRAAIAELFIVDVVISNSFRDALAPGAVGTAAMTTTLRNGLRKMGRALIGASKTAEQRACARRVRRDAKYIANAVRRKWDPEFEMIELSIDHEKVSMSQEDQRRHLTTLWLRGQVFNGEASGQFGKQPEVRPHGYTDYEGPPGVQTSPETQADVQTSPEIHTDIQKDAEAQHDVDIDYHVELYEDSDISEDEQVDAEAESALDLKILELKGFILHNEHMESLRDELLEVVFNHNSAAREGSGIPQQDTEDHQDAHQAGDGDTTMIRRSLPEIVDRWFPQWLDSLWESSKQRGVTRVRWTCACGKKLHDDYHGLEEEQLERLRTILHRSKPPSNPQTPVNGLPENNWASHAIAWTKTALLATWNAFRRNSESDTSIPLHNNPITSPPSTHLPVAGNSPRSSLFLLFSLQARGEGSANILRHATVEPAKLENDNDLFGFLRQRFYAERKFASRISLRTVSGIGNCMFWVDCSNFIQNLHRHTAACPANSVFSCDCWPPSSVVAQYRYIPQAPTEPFLMEKNYLLHHFRNPGCLDPEQTSVIRYIPMKKNCKLVGEASKPVTGWGIYFEEDWHWKTIFVVITVLMIIVSIVLGLTWWFVKSDFSGGWGVASFCVTSATLLVTVLGFMAHKSY